MTAGVDRHRVQVVEGQRVHRVRSIDAPSYEQAWWDFGEDHAQDVADGLRDLSYSLLPPLGWRMDGTVSTGHETT